MVRLILNDFGLYDMHGNLWEWCSDYYGEDYYEHSPQQDPTGVRFSNSQIAAFGFRRTSSGVFRVLRGGSWGTITRLTRSADRFRKHDSSFTYYDVGLGFRVVRELADPPQSTPPPVPAPAPAIDSITNNIGMTLNNIPAGTFMMGSPESELYRKDDETQHKVTISKAFYMQTTEVTQGQWKAVMGTEPWKGEDYVKEGRHYAASYVSWNDAVAFCKKLSEIEGKTYRLPTEAEWEYACRAETKTTWSFGNDEKVLGDYAWYRENAWDIDEKYAHQVRQKKPNAFGLYDMHGNVYEWCHDYYGEDYYKQSSEKDPTGPRSGSDHVVRGGSVFANVSWIRSASRSRYGADYRNYDLGFRLVRELD